MPLRREPPGARFLTVTSLRWVIRHRAYTAWYLLRYWRFFRFKLANPHVVTQGFVFLDRGAELYARRGLGRLILGSWLHVGAGTVIRCHEGTLRIGDKCTFGQRDSINCYLDVELGDSVLVADDVYISDFDHCFADRNRPIKDQGIVKSRVRVGADVWLGTKVTVTRGVAIGDGAVVGANAVVTRDIPDHTVAVGSPARAIRTRR
jgi:acetyltransferase-like isoleucine patch superfamily enzyme